MLEGQHLPGVWLVLTCLEPEQALEQTGRCAEGTQCVGLALALTPLRTSGPRIRLRVVCGTPIPEPSAGSHPRELPGSGFDLPRLEALFSLLHGEPGGDTKVVQLLDAGCRIELSQAGARELGFANRKNSCHEPHFSILDSRFAIHEARSTSGAERP